MWLMKLPRVFAFLEMPAMTGRRAKLGQQLTAKSI